MTKPSYDECLVEAERRARACYAEPGRHYHDERHLEECEQRLDAVSDLGEAEQRLLRWALLWHDAVYDPRRSDNEERSAELARRDLAACGVDEDAAAEVARLILLTKGHRVRADDRVGALMVSIDLAILGSDPLRYREYSNDVRNEYAHVPEDAWRAGRAAVLQSLMADGPIFADPIFRASLEDQARTNVEAELRVLGEG
jgi:predicted metal-dependent HD superfamily phosphohydrolase